MFSSSYTFIMDKATTQDTTTIVSPEDTMTFEEYISSWAYDRDERSAFMSVWDLIKDLHNHKPDAST